MLIGRLLGENACNVGKVFRKIIWPPVLSSSPDRRMEQRGPTRQRPDLVLERNRYGSLQVTVIGGVAE